MVASKETSGINHTIDSISVTPNSLVNGSAKKNNDILDTTVITNDNSALNVNKLIASSSRFGRMIANSYLPDITTVKKDETAKNVAK